MRERAALPYEWLTTGRIGGKARIPEGIADVPTDELYAALDTPDLCVWASMAIWRTLNERQSMGLSIPEVYAKAGRKLPEAR